MTLSSPLIVLALVLGVLVAIPGWYAAYRQYRARNLAGSVNMIIEFDTMRKKLREMETKVKNLTETLERERVLRKELELRVETLEDENKGLSSENGKLVVENTNLRKLLIDKWTGE